MLPLGKGELAAPLSRNQETASSQVGRLGRSGRIQLGPERAYLVFIQNPVAGLSLPLGRGTPYIGENGDVLPSCCPLEQLHQEAWTRLAVIGAGGALISSRRRTSWRRVTSRAFILPIGRPSMVAFSRLERRRAPRPRVASWKPACRDRSESTRSSAVSAPARRPDVIGLKVAAFALIDRIKTLLDQL